MVSEPSYHGQVVSDCPDRGGVHQDRRWSKQAQSMWKSIDSVERIIFLCDKRGWRMCSSNMDW